MKNDVKEINWKKLQNGSDLRGVAIASVENEPVNLTPAVVYVLGQAFSSWLAKKLNKPNSELTISVGRDSRLSGMALITELMAGIAAARVYDFGLASTPAMFMSTITPGFNCDGAIMLTASHLPFNRNGLKFFTADGGLEKQDISEILALAENAEIETAKNQKTAIISGPDAKISANAKIIKHDFIAVYAQQLVDKIRNAVNHPQNFAQPLQGLKILVDAGNGAGGFFAELVLKPLGADTTGSQFLEPDGNFPNHIPNPEDAEAMASICSAVIRHRADFGIIFDTDVDRSGAVDQFGRELNRNRLIALISAIILQEHPGSTIVTDSITSSGLTQFITKDLNGNHHRFKRGYKNVINEAVRLNQVGTESWLAIETSGHGAFKENYFLDDGAYLVSKLLIELAKSKLAGKTLTDLIANLPEPVESAEFRLQIGSSDFQNIGNQIISQLRAFAALQIDWQIAPHNYEGLRVDFGTGWFLLRLSLHDPLMPLNIESDIKGGINQIAIRLLAFFRDLPQELKSVNVTALSSYISAKS